MHYTVNSAIHNHADQSARLRRLICVFVVRFNLALAGFVVARLIWCKAVIIHVHVTKGVKVSTYDWYITN